MATRRGYSIVEVLIAASLFAVLLASVILVWTQSGRGAEKGYASVHAMRDLNLAFVRLRDDLGALILDRPVQAGSGAPIEVSLARTNNESWTVEMRFFKVYDIVSETNQPVAGQIVYTLIGQPSGRTLERAIHEITPAGVATIPRERKSYCSNSLAGFRLVYFSRDAATGVLTEIPDDVLRHDSPKLPDVLFLEIAHKDAARLSGYVTIPARYMRTARQRSSPYFLGNWLVPSGELASGTPVGTVSYHAGNSLNIGGTGIVLSTANLR